MSKTNNGANLGFENKLWEMADKMRGHMDSGEYKHVALGLIFPKYISDAFQAKYEALVGVYHNWRNTVGANPSVRPYEDKASWWKSAELYEQLAKADQLEATIKKNLEVLGFGE